MPSRPSKHTTEHRTNTHRRWGWTRNSAWALGNPSWATANSQNLKVFNGAVLTEPLIKYKQQTTGDSAVNYAICQGKSWQKILEPSQRTTGVNHKKFTGNLVTHLGRDVIAAVATASPIWWIGSRSEPLLVAVHPSGCCRPVVLPGLYSSLHRW